MKTLTGRIRHHAEPTRGSRFIATVSPVADEDEARRLLKNVAAEMPDASHHCWAWRLAEPPVDRAGDDGEPSGSAGRPILAQLTGRDLVNAAVVVTRYFGGTKLGVGGLVRAYGGAAGEALDVAGVVAYRRMTTASFVHPYADVDAVERVVSGLGAVNVDTIFGADVRRLVQIAEDDLEDLVRAVADATAGRATILSRP